MARNNQTKSYRLLLRWRRWKFKNTVMLVISLTLFVFLASNTPIIDGIIKQVGSLGYIGAFIAGMFFVSTFTVAPSAVVLYNMAQLLHPIEVAVLAGLGAMMGDYVMFRFLKDGVYDELRPVFQKMNHPTVRTLFKTPYFAWLLPLVGAFIIASPLPDEVGVGMLGLTKVRQWQFFLVTFLLNSVGIFVVVVAAKAI